MITATAKNWNELTQQEKNLWYDANCELIGWNETPEQAYERLNTPKQVDDKVEQYFDTLSVRLALLEETGNTLRCNGLTFWVTDK